MHILLIWLTALVAAAQTSSLNDDGVTRSASVMVRAVIDGDTIDVATIGRVHLLGIAAPTIGGRRGTTLPFARESRDRLAALVVRRWVRLEQPYRPMEGSNRSAYIVRDDGVFVNAVLAREGLARVSPRVTGTRRDELERAEAEARLFHRGVWGSASSDAGRSYTRRSNAGRARKPRATPNARKTRRKSQKPTT